MKRIHSLFIIWVGLASASHAQISKLADNIDYNVQLQGTAGSGDYTPFWFTNNRYGLGSTQPNSGLLRASLQRSAEADSTDNWRFGYGVDMAGAVNSNSNFVLQQLYTDLQFKAIRLSIGQKERPMELKNQSLSSGALTNGINARPLPQIRLELPDFWNIPRTRGWLAVKAHIAYGWYTDNKWQRNFTSAASHYTKNVLYHSKAGFIRVGNHSKFPLSLTVGLEMASQFGGEGWYVTKRLDDQSDFDRSHVEMGHSLKDYWNVFFPGGSDPSDGDYKNIEGNHLGSWHMRLDFEKAGWGASFYGEHFFDDRSQMYTQYGWKDMLYGAELKFPKNLVVTNILYEHLSTAYQSGGIYHDITPNFPEKLCGVDNYYNNGLYTGWHHAGYSMGTPLIISPCYNTDGNIFFYHNRIKAHHFGISGDVTEEWGYRMLFTHEKSLGTYSYPLTNPLYGNFLFIEASYKPSAFRGCNVSAAYGQNGGELLGHSKGVMLTFAYTGHIGKKKTKKENTVETSQNKTRQ